MYFVLRCFRPIFSQKLSIGTIPDVDGVDSWLSGRPIRVPVPQPLEITIDPDEPGDLLEMYQLEVLLMSDRLIAALGEAGVDNLQVYDTVIRGPATRRTFTSHKAVNVVGAIACADLERSVYSSPRGAPIIDVDFDSLAIDEERAGGHLFFRLAECVTAIIVHERVRDHLLARGFDTLTFQDPAQFVG